MDFKKFEEEAWEQKASKYNDTWGTVTSQPNNAILELLNIKLGMSLLDCGCGPGHFSSLASQKGARVTGCDYSNAMIDIARRNYPELNFVKEDAESLSFKDNTFDAIVLNYLLLHVADQEKVILESERVLKVDGRLVLTLWLPPSESPGLKLIFDAIMKYADMSVIPPAQDIFKFSDTSYATSFLIQSGFRDVELQRFETKWKVDTFGAFFYALQAGTRIGGMIDLQKAEVKEQIRSFMEQEIRHFQTAEGFEIPTPSIIVNARKSLATKKAS